MVPITYNIRNLIERKGTTLMTALGIGLTVAVLVTSVALTLGLRSVFASTSDPHHFLVLRKGTDAELTSTVARNIFEIVRTLPGVAKDAGGEPQVSPEGLSVINLPSIQSPEGMNVTVRGLLPVGLAMRGKFKMEQGERFKPGLRQVIVGQAIAQRYPDARIGNKLQFGKGSWDVVGVFSVGESASNSEIWLDLNQFNGDFERGGDSSSLLVGVNDPGQITDLKNRIESDQTLGATVISETDYYKALTNNFASQFLQYLGYAVAVIMAIGSAFAATNTMYAAVSRRTPEIGMLRALGFGRRAILVSFMAESIALALLGGVLGILLALPINGMAAGVGNFQTFSDVTFKFSVGWQAILLGLLFSILIGAFGGFLPAWSASRKSIIQAMREV